jgi:hypothetical protein
MTDDLVTRLREYADYRATADDLSRCLFSAADRIEQLEAALIAIIITAPFGKPQEIARAALGEKKDV